MEKIRQPQKKTSIDKKNRILQAGLKMFATQGFYKTTTIDIAKEANVSTGIVYSYFLNKNDILLQSLQLYFDNIYAPVYQYLEKVSKIDENTIKEFIFITIHVHKENYKVHEEMLALSHLNKDVHDMFMENESKMTQKISNYLAKITNSSHLMEKVHIAYNIVENLCHECVYHQHTNIDYDYYIKQTIIILSTIFSTM